MKPFAGLVAIVYVVLRGLLFPPTLTPDSFDYLQQSLTPTIGSSHAFGFGFILRLMFEVTSWLGHPNWTLEVYVVFQSVWIAALAWVPFELTRSMIDRAMRNRTRRASMLAGAILLLAFWLLVFPGLLFLGNSVWSEGAFLLLFVVASRVICDKDASLWRRAAFVLLVLFGYYVRFQMAVLPAAVLLTSAAEWLRAANRRAVGGLATAAIALLLIPMSTMVLRNVITAREGGGKNLVRFVSMSAQCSLRCKEQHLWSGLDCSTPASESLMRTFSCSEAVNDAVPVGALAADVTSVGSLVAHLGPVNVLRWIAVAPVVYFSDIHAMWGLEEGQVAPYFEQQGARMKPAAAEYFAPGFSMAASKRTAMFSWLLRGLWQLYFRWRVFHVIFALVILASMAVFVLSTDRLSRVWAASSVLTLLVYAFVDPEVPLRFLLMGIMPGYLAVIRLIAKRLQPKGDPELRPSP